MEKKNSLLRLAAFAAETNYDTLPPELTAYIKQLLLDTLGCGVAGMASDICLDNYPHFVPPAGGELLWPFFKQFRRDQATGKIICEEYKA